MPWTRQHLLTLEALSLAEIDQIHATAAAFKRTKWVERALNWSFAAIFTAFAATILTAQARHG